MRVNVDQLSDDATIWVFGITPGLDERGRESVLMRVETFLDQWLAHGVPVVSSADVRELRFLVVAAEKKSETSGCSIDRMFGLIRQLESELGVVMLDADRLFYRGDDGMVRAVSRAEFGKVATTQTAVFDTAAQRLGDIRSGAWEKPAGRSWHARLLQADAGHSELAARIIP